MCWWTAPTAITSSAEGVPLTRVNKWLARVVAPVGVGNRGTAVDRGLFLWLVWVPEGVAISICLRYTALTGIEWFLSK